jgi:multiple antibiotic resistance protein
MLGRVTNRSLPLVLCIAPVALCIYSWAQGEPASSERVPVRSFSFGEMFTFFFLMLGPLKILGPFVQMTHNGDPAFARRLAFRGFAYSCVALLLAAIVGENSINKYHISIPVLGIAAGVILFLVALRTVMEEFDRSTEASPKVYEPNLLYALSPLTFPTIVTPYGVAAVIICMALTPEYLVKGQIYAALFGLMVLNLIAMLFAKPILKYLGIPMLLLGTVLGVIQVALGLSIIFAGLRRLGFGAGN